MSSVAGDLPPDLQKIVELEVARALKATEPEAPKEETIAEAADRLLGMIVHYEAEDKPVPSGSRRTHAAIYDILALLIQAVFHPEDSAPAEPAAAEPAPVNGGGS